MPVLPPQRSHAMSSAVDNDTSGGPWLATALRLQSSFQLRNWFSLLACHHSRVQIYSEVKFTEDTGHYRIRFTALSSQNVGASS